MPWARNSPVRCRNMGMCVREESHEQREGKRRVKIITANISMMSSFPCSRSKAQLLNLQHSGGVMLQAGR